MDSTGAILKEALTQRDLCFDEMKPAVVGKMDLKGRK